MVNPISGTSRDVGRPALDVKPTVVRLTKKVIEQIDKVAGKHRRAEFIREAVERELNRRERARERE